MINNLYNLQIEKLIVHHVGNKNKGETVNLSSITIPLDDELHSIFKEYFTKQFRKKITDSYVFDGEPQIAHEVKAIFKNDGFVPRSHAIATILYNLSNHPHIRSGELFIALFDNANVDNERCQAVGIFKTERKQDFLQYEQTSNNLVPILKYGDSVDKLDKAALIYNHSKGPFIQYFDNNRYDSKYWLEFLSIEPYYDAEFCTTKYLKFAQDFAKEIVLPLQGKQAQVEYMQQTTDYLAVNDLYHEQHYLENIVDPELVNDFNQYFKQYASKYGLENVDEFEISNKAVTAFAKAYKGPINLDTNITLNIKSSTACKHVEKGWDEEKQMYYYLVYFNKEEKK